MTAFKVEYGADEGSSDNQLFPENINIRVPRGFKAAVWTVARRKHSRPAEVIRQFALAGLEAEGVTLTEAAP